MKKMINDGILGKR